MATNQNEINPLYEKMCQIYFIQGNSTIGEAMQKRAAKYKTIERTVKIKKIRHEIPAIANRALRAVAVCLSLLTLTAVLIVCAYLGKTNSGFFAKIVGIYANNTPADVSGEFDYDIPTVNTDSNIDFSSL